MTGKWEKLLYKLHQLDMSELRAIRRWNDWCNIAPWTQCDGETDFTRRIRNSAETAITNPAREVTYAEFEDYLRTVIQSDTRRPQTRVADTVMAATIMELDHASDIKRELWLSAQLYGYLQAKFENSEAVNDLPGDLHLPSYRVSRERPIYGYSVDLFIESKREGQFIIEVKSLANVANTGEKTIREQLQRYNNAVDNHSFTWLLILYQYNHEWKSFDCDQLSGIATLDRTDYLDRRVGR